MNQQKELYKNILDHFDLERNKIIQEKLELCFSNNSGNINEFSNCLEKERKHIQKALKPFDAIQAYY